MHIGKPANSLILFSRFIYLLYVLWCGQAPLQKKGSGVYIANKFGWLKFTEVIIKPII